MIIVIHQEFNLKNVRRNYNLFNKKLKLKKHFDQLKYFQN